MSQLADLPRIDFRQRNQWSWSNSVWKSKLDLPTGFCSCTRLENLSELVSDSKIDVISKDEWPLSSPDLNPMDYSLWCNLEARVCAKPHKSLKSLKTSLMKEWLNLPQEELRNSIKQFRTRLRDVINKKGGYIE